MLTLNESCLNCPNAPPLTYFELNTPLHVLKDLTPPPPPLSETPPFFKHKGTLMCK